MNLIEQILKNSSIYERNLEIFLLLAIFLLSQVAIYLSTKNKRILILSLISFTLLFVLNVLGLILINGIFHLEISEIFKIVPVLSSILLISNLGILTGFYISRKDSKNFNISSIRKEYLSDSIKQTVFLTLLGSSTLLFLSPQTEGVIAISILSTVLTIWLTYWISRYILK